MFIRRQGKETDRREVEADLVLHWLDRKYFYTAPAPVEYSYCSDLLISN